MICLTVARSGPLESPLQSPVQVLLDGPLSMLRNVHKVDPLVRLPLALGLAQLATAWWPAAGRRRAGARTIAQALVVVVLLVSAQPLWSGDLRKPGWDAVPDAWSEAAAYLAEQDGSGSTLVLPGVGFRPAGLGLDHRRAHPGSRDHAVGGAQPGAADPRRHDPQPRCDPGADRPTARARRTSPTSWRARASSTSSCAATSTSSPAEHPIPRGWTSPSRAAPGWCPRRRSGAPVSASSR